MKAISIILISVILILSISRVNKPHVQDLYVIYDKKTKLHKIGKSKNIDNRLYQLERKVNSDLKVCKVYLDKGYIEKDAHMFFESKNVKVYHNGSTGHEWFLLTKQDLKTLDSLIHSVR